MTKLLKITQCSHCKFFCYNEILVEYTCVNTAIGFKTIKDYFSIPEWCRLEDYTITGMLDK